MRIGDLVEVAMRAFQDAKYIGLIVDFDEDNDPIILWNIDDTPTPENREYVRVIRE